MPVSTPNIKISDRILTRLKLKQLRLLVAIARHASILHAAHELNISQPAATKLIKDLEADFGVRLFDRTNRGTIPTIYGQKLIHHAKLILNQISTAAQELDDLNEGTGGQIVVGTLLAASAHLLPDAISSLYQQRPNVSIHIREATNDVLMPALASGEIDMVVGRLPEFRHRHKLAREILLEEEICVVTRPGHPLAGQRKVSFKTLSHYRWILPPAETSLRRQLEKVFFDHNLNPPKASIESISFLVNRQLLTSTDLICAMPRAVVTAELEQKLLVKINCPEKIASNKVGVSFRKDGSITPAAALFLDILRQTAGVQQQMAAT
jgi:DNA-binding transcriptional LysR family regulator